MSRGKEECRRGVENAGLEKSEFVMAELCEVLSARRMKNLSGRRMSVEYWSVESNGEWVI